MSPWYGDLQPTIAYTRKAQCAGWDADGFMVEWGCATPVVRTIGLFRPITWSIQPPDKERIC
jgi:hypothetical protein